MFDDSGFGGSSMFDSNHDGHLNAFERDHAECFLHDCDTFDQVIKKEGSSDNYSRTGSYSSVDWSGVIFWLVIVAIITTIGTLMGL